MSFFDTILDTAEQPEKTGTKQHGRSKPVSGHDQEFAKTGENEKNPSENGDARPLPAVMEGKTPNAKPEKLSFLRPCPLCGGRHFIYGPAGGFSCVTCQPGISGLPVEAAGPDRQPTTPQHPAGILADNQIQTALGGNCTAPLTRRTTSQDERNFSVAWLWIKDKMPILLAAGWSRAALLRRGKHRGAWGIAWLSVWRKPSLAVTVGVHGEIIFTYQSGDRKIKQTAFPDISFFQTRKSFHVEPFGGVRNPRGTRRAREDP